MLLVDEEYCIVDVRNNNDIHDHNKRNEHESLEQQDTSQLHEYYQEVLCLRPIDKNEMIERRNSRIIKFFHIFLFFS